jgi:hypothetical protein
VRLPQLSHFALGAADQTGYLRVRKAQLLHLSEKNVEMGLLDFNKKVKIIRFWD